MKKSLSPESRALFEAGRQGLCPRGDDRARVAAALGLKLGVGAGIAAGTVKAAAGSAVTSAVTSTSVAGLSSGGIVAAKWIAVVAVVAGIGTGGVALYQHEAARAPSPPPAGFSSSLPSLPPHPPPVVGRGSSPVVPPPVPEALGVPSPGIVSGPGTLGAATGAASGRKSSLPASAPRPASTASSTASDAIPVASAPPVAGPAASAPPPGPGAARVADEARLLREADAALRSGDTAEATRLLDEHARDFPHGVLAEERDVQRVLVLCAAGRTDAARVEAGRFLSTYPQSLLAGRVRASCVAP